MVLSFIMYEDLTFLASAVGFFSPTETTFQLCFPWLNDVVNPVISDLWKNPLIYCQERSSWATKQRCLGGTGKVDPGDGTPDGKKIQWFRLSCWCCPVQEPWLLDTNNHTESKQWPPPLLWTDGDAVLVHNVVHAINTSHCLVVVLHHERLCDLHCLCLSSGPALCYLGSCNSNRVWNCVV